jgi:septal ring factor EnvC (AmiA/AmiB activator)
MQRILLVFALLGVGLTPRAAAAQDPTRDLRQSQLRLDSIRQERERLQREMEGLQTRVRDASRELTNLHRQRAASAGALQELEFQAEVLAAQMATTQEELDGTTRRLDDRSSSLKQRLRSIYKRGPLHTVRVLMSAESFGDLLNRYKYLHLITVYDRRVVEDVSLLERTLRLQEQDLELTLSQLEGLRVEKATEVAQLRRLETASQQTLGLYRREESQVAAELDRAAQDEARLSNAVVALERERREAEARSRAAGTPAVAGPLSGRHLGSLAWPVDGDVIYRFGPVVKSTGITLVNKGIGIKAPAGTPVRAVEAGDVVLARNFEGYGPTVMISHGSGYYSLYLYLRAVSVREGQRINGGQVVGSVGGDATPEGAHLYFQIHAPLTGESPEPVDPLLWLRPRGQAP